LSACQTAAGDERAALGIAGVAIKSGAQKVHWQVYGRSKMMQRRV